MEGAREAEQKEWSMREKVPFAMLKWVGVSGLLRRISLGSFMATILRGTVGVAITAADCR